MTINQQLISNQAFLRIPNFYFAPLFTLNPLCPVCALLQGFCRGGAKEHLNTRGHTTAAFFFSYILKWLDGRKWECPWREGPFISSRNSSGTSVCSSTESSIYTLAVLLVSVHALFHTLAFQSSCPVSSCCALTIKGVCTPALTPSVRLSHIASTAVLCGFVLVRPACRRL